jgi:hypothetical protein
MWVIIVTLHGMKNIKNAAYIFRVVFITLFITLLRAGFSVMADSLDFWTYL